MKQINQTKNWSTCLHGWTLPKNSVYGSIHGKEYVCINANIITAGGFRVKIWNPGKGVWFDRHTSEGHGDIYVRIRDYKKTAEYCPENPVACHTVTLPERQKMAEAAERAKKLEQQRRERAWNETLREIGCPQEKRPQGATAGYLPFVGSCYSQSAVDGKGYTNEYEYTSGMNIDGYQPVEAVTGKVDLNKLFFEQGQNTSGDAGKYTRSGFEVKRDGMKTRFADYHGQKPERPAVSNPFKVEKDERTGKHYITKNGVKIPD